MQSLRVEKIVLSDVINILFIFNLFILSDKQNYVTMLSENRSNIQAVFELFSEVQVSGLFKGF